MFTNLLRKLIQAAGYGKVLVLDDRENLTKHLNSQQPSLGYCLNQQAEAFSLWIESVVGTPILHAIFGNPVVLAKLGLDVKHMTHSINTFNNYGKNGADIAMALHAAEYIKSPWVTRVVIISNDSDFAPLIQYLQGHAIQVLLLSPVQKAARGLACTCSNLINIQPFLRSLQQTLPTPAPRVPPTQNSLTAKLKQKMLITLTHYANEQGRVNLATVGQLLIKNFNAKQRNWFGYGSCKKLVLNLCPDFIIQDNWLINIKIR